MQEIPLCEICLEPITNSVCPECLGKAVEQWLEGVDPKLIEKFRRVHREFIDTTISHKTTTCVVCKKEYYHMVCPYDYIKEIYSWLNGKLKKDKLLEFLKVFSLGFREIDVNIIRWRFYKFKVPILFSKNPADLGLCEACENFSENIQQDESGRTVCEDCRI